MTHAPPPGFALLRALRPHQWAKNLLVFLPLLTSHQMFDATKLARVAVAFVAFCLCSSASYLLNDRLDLAADRGNPRKCDRPFASGALPPGLAFTLAPLLAASGLLLGLTLDSLFVPVLATYLALSTAYSLFLKRLVVLDVIVLAALYTARVLGGAAAVSIPPSSWLLGFCMFLFLSLAVAKRYAELLTLREASEDALRGRGYRRSDLDTLLALGVATGCLAVLVLALYVDSANVRLLYTRPHVLWLLGPLLLYWIGRLWIITRRGEMHHDPVVFVLRDVVSGVVLVLAALAVWLAV